MNRHEDPELIPWLVLTPQALHGLAGEFVRAISSHSESDPAALLIMYLSAFGNVIGRNAHFRVEADDHHMTIFANVLGNTCPGQKDMVWTR